MVSGKNVLTHVQVMKNKNPSIQKIESRVESKIAKIKEKLGVSTPPPKKDLNKDCLLYTSPSPRD